MLLRLSWCNPHRSWRWKAWDSWGLHRHPCLRGRASSLRRGTRPDDVTCYNYSSTTHHDSLDLSPSSTAALDLSSWFSTCRRLLLSCLTSRHGSPPTVVFRFGIRPLITALDLLSSPGVAFTIMIALHMHHQHPSIVTRAHSRHPWIWGGITHASCLIGWMG